MLQLWPSGEYMYFECQNCRLKSISPTPSAAALTAYYATNYRVDPDSYGRNTSRFAIRDLQLLEGFCKRGSLLEIGSSWGSFLQISRDRGWQVKGVELSEAAATSARNDRRLQVFSGTIEQFATPQELSSYDAVVAWHVIEHTRDPAMFLQTARDLLKPGGFIALRTPNAQGLLALANGDHWQWTGAPAHLFLFSRKAVASILEQSGFAVVHLSTRRGDAHNPAFELLRGTAMRLGVHRRVKQVLALERQQQSSDVSAGNAETGEKRSSLLRRLNSLFDWALFPVWPIEKLSAVYGLGAEILVVAKRH